MQEKPKKVTSCSVEFINYPEKLLCLFLARWIPHDKHVASAQPSDAAVWVRVTPLRWRLGLREHVALPRRESLARRQEPQSGGCVLPRDSFLGVGIHGSLGFQGSFGLFAWRRCSHVKSSSSTDFVYLFISHPRRVPHSQGAAVNWCFLPKSKTNRIKLGETN